MSVCYSFLKVVSALNTHKTDNDGEDKVHSKGQLKLGLSYPPDKSHPVYRVCMDKDLSGR